MSSSLKRFVIDKETAFQRLVPATTVTLLVTDAFRGVEAVKLNIYLSEFWRFVERIALQVIDSRRTKH